MHCFKFCIVSGKVLNDFFYVIRLYYSLFIFRHIGNKILEKRHIAFKAASHHHTLQFLDTVNRTFNYRDLSFIYKRLRSISFRTYMCLVIDIFKQCKDQIIRHFKEMIISFKATCKVIPCFFLMPFDTISGAPLHISHRLYTPSFI